MKSLLSDFYPPNSAGAIVAYARGLDAPQIETYGFANIADKIPFAASNVFDLASVSKTFTGAALALLYQRGELNPSSPIEAYLPTLNHSGSSRTITVQDLLWQTSDIPDYLGHFSEEQTRIIRNSDVVEFAAEQVQTCQPGVRFEYSNTNYALLASIVEAVSGQHYAEFLEEELFKPLGLRNTYVIEPGKKLENRVKGYEKRDDGEFIESQLDIYVLGDGGVFSTVTDLVKWSQSYLKERQLLTKETADLVFTSGQTDSGEPVGYGWGIYTVDTDEGKWLEHRGGWIGVSTLLRYNPQTDTTLVVLSNQVSAPIDSISQIYVEAYSSY